ncbi:MAG: hypothetical protein V1798_00935 [Pseudomonadota bacterium]
MRPVSLLSAALVLPILLVFGNAVAQQPKKAPDGTETATYLQAVENLHDKSIDLQVDGWRQFLKDHPQSPYRNEIENNLRNLEDLLANTNPLQMKEKRDTERYLRAVEYAKKLPFQDQIAFWEQFLDENPQSIYRREAGRTLEELKARVSPSAPVAAPPKSSSEAGPAPPGQFVAPQLNFKDPQKATLLATFPGLIVPGIGEWYAHEYATAGILTGIQVGGAALAIPGIINNNVIMIVLGSALFGFSYIYDIVDAPFAVRRYNDALEQKKAAQALPPDRDRFSASLSFRF